MKLFVLMLLVRYLNELFRSSSSSSSSSTSNSQLIPGDVGSMNEVVDN